MNDKTKFKRLMRGFGITGMREAALDETKDTVITIEQNCCPSVGGYSGFCVDFEFDANGKFLRMGVWE